MNLIFAGTPAFAVPALEALLQARHRILAVYTQPDRPAGRGRALAASAVKRAALTHGLEVRQPPKLRDDLERLRADAPEIMIVIAYGQLLTPELLGLPARGCLNVHASLLPRWRGAAPIARALEAGDRDTGVSIMQMEAGLDTGPVLARTPTPIAEHDTAASLHDRLAVLGAQTLVATLDQLARGTCRALAQDPALACYAKKLRKDEAALDWRLSAAALHRKIRAFNPWPVATARWRGQLLRLWEVGPHLAAAGDAAPGTVTAAAPDGIVVQAGDGAVRVTRLQAEGGKILTAAEFLNGRPLAVGDRWE